jgi:hypothetical protein
VYSHQRLDWIEDFGMTTSTLAPAADSTAQGTAAGMTEGAVRAWLRLEGLAAFIAGVALFAAGGGSLLAFIPLLLVPDVSALGYLAGPRVGAFTYNLAHTWAPGLVVLGLSVWLTAPTLQLVAAILIAHVGMDRAVGYGLKLPTSFQDTHLGRMGRAKA